MSPKLFDEILSQLIEDEVAILASKGDDYTDNGEGNADEDRLWNFKEVAKRFGVSPLTVWGIYWTKHNNAIEKFVRTGQLASEPIEERIKDARNYLALGLALIKEDEFGELGGYAQNPITGEITEYKTTPINLKDQPEENQSLVNKLFGKAVSAPSS